MLLDEKRIIFLCVLLCILGLLLLYFFGETLVRTTPIGAKFSPQGTNVQFSGSIEKLTVRDNGCTLSVCDSSCISVSVDESTFPCALLGKGSSLLVTGRVKQVEAGSKFVQASKIILQ
ncbi:Uncharacterised protein [Candidatus Anstonella stagnisolia]|nr:Uncharacterised protein [Candidatus Anstonella stagnisolia]